MLTTTRADSHGSAPSIASEGGGTMSAPMDESVGTWLESIGRLKYAAAFSENFETLADLRLATRREGIPAVLEACGVKGMGDKAALGEALEALMSSKITGNQPASLPQTAHPVRNGWLEA